jgi:hypothetical protein
LALNTNQSINQSIFLDLTVWYYQFQWNYSKYWKLSVSVILLIKTLKSVLKVSTYIINSITFCPVRLTAILVIMSISTFKTDIILYLSTTQGGILLKLKQTYNFKRGSEDLYYSQHLKIISFKAFYIHTNNDNVLLINN